MKRMYVLILFLPIGVHAQTLSNGTYMQSVLDQLYNAMMPMCGQLIGSARLIAGLATLCYIGMRVWKSIAAAEPLDLFGLLRPFVIGFCILIFPSFITLLNGILQPTVAATSYMVRNSNTVMEKYLAAQQASNGGLGMLNPASWIRAGIKEILEVVFQTAALIIDVIRTFYLIVLAIIGPIVFALSIFDGFQHLLTVWLARYINVFLWLPVANIFGAIIAKVQETMIANAPVDDALPYSTTNWAYIAFLLIGVIGYFTVPSVANYIVNAGGGNALLHKVTSMTVGAAKQTASAVTTASTGMSADAFGKGANKMTQGMSESGASNNYFKEKIKG